MDINLEGLTDEQAIEKMKQQGITEETARKYKR